MRCGSTRGLSASFLRTGVQFQPTQAAGIYPLLHTINASHPGLVKPKISRWPAHLPWFISRWRFQNITPSSKYLTVHDGATDCTALNIELSLRRPASTLNCLSSMDVYAEPDTCCIPIDHLSHAIIRNSSNTTRLEGHCYIHTASS